MFLEGQLNLSHGDCSYLIFYQGRNVNLSDYLYAMYVDKSDVSIKITDVYSKKILFDAKGELWKNKVQPMFYDYFVGEFNLDKVLWENVGKRLGVQIKNISTE